MDKKTDPAFRTLDVPVAGGSLRVALWGEAGPVVLCSHGLTANHTEFQSLADHLGPSVRVIAPDHRGRGHSNGITGPWGIGAHADDLAALLDHLKIDKVDVLVGHSMGGFVAAVTAARHPDRIGSVVLVDGGIPLANFAFIRFLPFSNWITEKLVRKILGPSLQRLEMTFESHEAYTAFWKKHPALSGDQWSDYVEQYVAYDVVGEPPNLRSGIRKDGLWDDVRTQLVETLVPESLPQIKCPVRFLRAQYGILGDKPLYAEDALTKATSAIPKCSIRTLQGTNHFTILLSERGGRLVAEEVRGILDGAAK